MKNLLILFVASLLSLGFSSCNKEEVLPAATQDGKNTFGCLVNGKVWTPKGYNGTSNLDVHYDPYFEDGFLGLTAYRILNDDDQQYINFFVLGFDGVGTYKLDDFERASGRFSIIRKCSYDYIDKVARDGTLIITNFDLSRGIVSGTFEFTLSKEECDTIRVTQGRFDMKI